MRPDHARRDVECGRKTKQRGRVRCSRDASEPKSCSTCFPCSTSPKSALTGIAELKERRASGLEARAEACSLASEGRRSAREAKRCRAACCCVWIELSVSITSVSHLQRLATGCEGLQG